MAQKLMLAALVLHAFVMVHLVRRATDLTPPVQPEDSSSELFSEARALQHVKALAVDIGMRRLSTPGLQQATRYLQQQTEALASLAAATRPDLLVEVSVDHVSGAIAMDFLGRNFTNAYANLTLVHLWLAPRAYQHLPALLLSAHYDSPAWSPGASDDASQVAVMLEAARAIISDPSRTPHAPLLFLFDGGEEALSPAAHGFMARSPYAARLGAFINLESTGPGGLPIVFQHSGVWPVQAYAQGAVIPRGSSLAQDLFDAGAVPGDTNYRMFSYRHYGSLPGVDIAFVRDSSAYHTQQDSYERVARGSLQEMGESLLGCVGSFTARLAGGKEEEEQQQQQHKAVFIDILGLHMVSYPMDAARLYHDVPLAIVLSMPVVLGMVGLPKRSVAAAYRSMFGAAVRGLISVASAVLVPGLFGALRVAVFGKPIVWYAQHWVAYCCYMPFALLGALLPWLAATPAKSWSKPDAHVKLGSSVLGCSLLLAVAAAGLTRMSAGSSFVFAWPAAAGGFVGAVFSLWGLNWGSLLGALALASLPLVIGAEVTITFLHIMMDRVSLSGAIPAAAGDVACGVLFGVLVVASTGLFMLPVVALLMGTGVRRRLAQAVLLAMVLAAGASLAFHPYSAQKQKKVMVQHLVNTAAAGGGQQQEVVGSRLVLAGADPTPLESFTRHLAPLNLSEGSVTGVEWANTFPFSEMVDSKVYELPAQLAQQQQGQQRVPFVRVEAAEQLPEGGRKLQLQVVTHQPCWGLVNITSASSDRQLEIRSWSFTSSPPPADVAPATGARQYCVRFTTELEGGGLGFLLEVGGQGQVHVQLTVMYMEPMSGVTGAVLRVLPAWVGPMLAVQTFQSSYVV